MKERSPGVWWLRAYAGRSSTGKPVEVSRTIRGGKRLPQANLTNLVAAEPAGAAGAAGAAQVAVTVAVARRRERVALRGRLRAVPAHRRHFGQHAMDDPSRILSPPCLPFGLRAQVPIATCVGLVNAAP